MCTCCVWKINGNIFSSFPSGAASPSTLAWVASQLSCVVNTETPWAVFSSGLPDHFHSYRTENVSQPNSFLPFLCLLGLVLALPFGSSGWLDLFRTPLPSTHRHTCLCLSPCWGHSRRTVRVTREPDAAKWSESSCSGKITSSLSSGAARCDNVKSKLLYETKVQSVSLQIFT